MEEVAAEEVVASACARAAGVSRHSADAGAMWCALITLRYMSSCSAWQHVMTMDLRSLRMKTTIIRRVQPPVTKERTVTQLSERAPVA